MAEYIKREAAEKVASKYGCSNGSVIGRHNGLADCIANDIAKLPATDVAPVVHGRWELTAHPFTHKCESCSICGYMTVYGSSFRHCPSCGAKMDLEASR